MEFCCQKESTTGVHEFYCRSIDISAEWENVVLRAEEQVVCQCLFTRTNLSIC